MPRKALGDLNVAGRQVLVRVDFNVPLKEGTVVDDTRIRAALPTITHLLEHGAKVVLMSHLGRPKGERKSELTLAPVADHLATLLGRPARLAPDCVGAEVDDLRAMLSAGDVLLLENLRFHGAETKNEPRFCHELARGAEVYINDAFGTAHRAHASTVGVAGLIDEKAAGFLVEKELAFLGGLLAAPEDPFVAILGGAKVSGKIEVIENLLPKVAQLLIGGAMMFTFWRALGMSTGRSLVEDDLIATAEELLKRAKELGKEIVLPVDCIATRDLEAGAAGRIAEPGQLTAEELGADIGPATRRLFAERIAPARTIFWNGPMGVFEQGAYAAGTLAMATAVADATRAGATSVVGGGDSVAAVKSMGLGEAVSHVSTGGGASLEFLEGKTLPGIAALES